jgi:hypothetical protein
METQTSHLCSQFKAFFPSTSKFFFHRIPQDTFSPRIAKTQFHPNIMKDISESNETCFIMILNENLIILSHVRFFSFRSNFHRPHMILVVQPVCQVCEFKHLLNSESHEKWKSRSKLLKIHNIASIKFSSLLIFKLSSCDSSPSLITGRWRIFES